MVQIQPENALEEAMMKFYSDEITPEDFGGVFSVQEVFIPQRSNEFVESECEKLEIPFLKRNGILYLAVYSSRTQLTKAAPSPFVVSMKGHALMTFVPDGQPIVINPYGPFVTTISASSDIEQSEVKVPKQYKR